MFPPDLYAFHRYTGNSTLLSKTLVTQFKSSAQVEPRDFHLLNKTAYARFTPSNSD